VDECREDGKGERWKRGGENRERGKKWRYRERDGEAGREGEKKWKSERWIMGGGKRVGEKKWMGGEVMGREVEEGRRGGKQEETMGLDRLVYSTNVFRLANQYSILHEAGKSYVWNMEELHNGEGGLVWISEDTNNYCHQTIINKTKWFKQSKQILCATCRGYIAVTLIYIAKSVYVIWRFKSY
jgi:hypothetical protein